MQTNCTGLLINATSPLTRRRGRSGQRVGRDEGMATAEYAIGTVAACGFGGVLFQLLTSDSVANLLKSVITKALSMVFG